MEKDHRQGYSKDHSDADGDLPHFCVSRARRGAGVENSYDSYDEGDGEQHRDDDQWVSLSAAST